MSLQTEKCEAGLSFSDSERAASMLLPPLNALKAFEAAVRLGGFTPAASELGVSPAAVSMQVKNAEAFLGKTLFHRLNNRLLLTDAGRTYYPAISEALTAISTATENLIETEARSGLAVSTIQSLAENWVAPAISRFREAFPGTGIELRIEADPVDLLNTRTDLRVTYESNLYPQHTQLPLFKDVAHPFCTQAFYDSHVAGSGIAAVPDALLIHTDWGEQYASHPTWANWFRAAGLARNPNMRKGLRVGGAAVALELARQGAGIALVPKMLAEAKHPASLGVVVGEPGLPLPYAYFAIVPQSAAQQTGAAEKNPPLQAFLEELIPKDAPEETH
ncbi:LysR substrate-binding domain-containing protein [Leisingera sp. M523]|uniref:LysR substrate-binding domain-containing protein n=1 Tax=Leisingera sp. M523 TaxID=2867013 RepID=UPI0021A633A8|nr:LysR substrate-binding domain-containing protein [Leisingera sp. M523]UWQ30195.1 LysR family transcriptional regulator [Leisingera sp. M523]